MFMNLLRLLAKHIPNPFVITLHLSHLDCLPTIDLLELPDLFLVISDGVIEEGHRGVTVGVVGRWQGCVSLWVKVDISAL